MKKSFIAIFLLLFVWLPSQVEARMLPYSKRGTPNIIYIVADGLGFDELGYYGQTLIETPNIDALAREGMVFTHYYMGQATEVASRYSLLTGLHSGHAYIRGNDEIQERGDIWNYRSMLGDSTLEGQRPVPERTVMIPQKFKEAGYVTACFGKWGLGYPGSGSTPCKMGFDFFYGYNCQRQAFTYYPPFLYRNERRVYLNNQFLEPGTGLDTNDDPNDPLNYARYASQDYAPEKIYMELLKFIRQRKDEAFALFWTSPLPGGALQVSEKWLSYYLDKVVDEAPFLGNRRYSPCRYPKATYAAKVSCFDEQVGGLVQLLKDLGIYENTLLVLTGGNHTAGEVFTDELNAYRLSFSKNRSGLGEVSLSENKLHVPMFVSWPKEIEIGVTSDFLTASWDVMTTLCDLVKVEQPVTDGISWLPTLRGKQRKQKEHTCLYWENAEADGEIAVRFGVWKAFVSDVMKGNREVRLFDLSVDPNEYHNVAKQHPDVVEQVLHLIKEGHTPPILKIFDFPTW